LKKAHINYKSSNIHLLKNVFFITSEVFLMVKISFDKLMLRQLLIDLTSEVSKMLLTLYI